MASNYMPFFFQMIIEKTHFSKCHQSTTKLGGNLVTNVAILENVTNLLPKLGGKFGSKS